MDTLPNGFEPKDENDPKCDEVRGKTEEKLREVGSGWSGFAKAKRLFAFAFDRSRPWRRRALALGALTYFVCPLDLWPDVLPGGLLDDLLVIAFVAAQVLDEFAQTRDGSLG